MVFLFLEKPPSFAPNPKVLENNPLSVIRMVAIDTCLNGGPKRSTAGDMSVVRKFFQL